jgi:hypothetical protein
LKRVAVMVPAHISHPSTDHALRRALQTERDGHRTRGPAFHAKQEAAHVLD